MRLSFEKIFYILSSLIGFIAILILAKAVLIPLTFALLISFILYPLTKKIESLGANEIIAAFLSILLLFVILFLGIFFLTIKIENFSDSISNFEEKILEIFTQSTLYLNKNIGFLPQIEKDDLLKKLELWLSKSGGSLVTKTFSGTAELVIGSITATVYTFLFLIYRNGIVKALLQLFSEEKREKALKTFKSIQNVGQKYIFGMFIIVLILGVVNSLGLWIIGIDNPFLFGFLAAILALIPYAGTFIGAAIPILYAFLFYDSLWMPLTIAIFFWVVQFVESNFLTPKIVGGNLNINALTSILSIIIGASVWGVAGMILFLPLAAMFKVVCEEIESLKPIAMLIGEENYIKKK